MLAAATALCCCHCCHRGKPPCLPFQFHQAERHQKKQCVKTLVARAAGLLLGAGAVWLAGSALRGAAPQRRPRSGHSRAERAARRHERARARDLHEIEQQEAEEAAWRRKEIKADQLRRERPDAQARRAGEHQRQSKAMLELDKQYHGAWAVAAYAMFATAWYDHRRWRAAR